MISYSSYLVAQIIKVGLIQGCQTNILDLVGKKSIPNSTHYVGRPQHSLKIIEKDSS